MFSDTAAKDRNKMLEKNTDITIKKILKSTRPMRPEAIARDRRVTLFLVQIHIPPEVGIGLPVPDDHQQAFQLADGVALVPIEQELG
jgi:hypothetical protein